MIDKTETLAKSQLFTLKGEVVSEGSNSDGQTAIPRQRRFLTGQIIDQKYKITGFLGEGGMGAVYKAHHLLLNKEMALKTFSTTSLSEDALLRFQREAQAIAKLTHRNIVQVFDFGQGEDNVPYYTMECLVGESLADRLKARGYLPLEEALPIFQQVCSGLSLAHSKGIAHRDMKPGNIFLVEEGAKDLVKIVDFGMAGLATRTLDSQKLTSTGIVFGSPLYMSPEQSMGDPVSHQSDIYSCGCSLFETLTGTPPYQGANAFATMLLHQQSRIPELVGQSKDEEFPRRLKALTAHMMAKSAEDRPQSFDQIANELKGVIDLHKATTQAPATVHNLVPNKSTSPQNKKAIFVALVALAVLLTCVISGTVALLCKKQSAQTVADKSDTAADKGDTVLPNKGVIRLVTKVMLQLSRTNLWRRRHLNPRAS